ncbi:MAG: pentapeptide repeat-containing protein [Patescibacteria group bacterium]
MKEKPPKAEGEKSKIELPPRERLARVRDDQMIRERSKGTDRDAELKVIDPAAAIETTSKAVTDAALSEERLRQIEEHPDTALSRIYAWTLEGKRILRKDLEGLDLKGADLRNLDLFDADLHNLDLTGADLRGANLKDTFCLSANFTDANLEGAKFDIATLSHANFTGANLEGADLSGLHEGKTIRTDFTGANLKGADLHSVHFRNRNFTGANLEGADLTNTSFLSVDLTEANLRGAKIDYRSLQGSIRPDPDGPGWIVVHHIILTNTDLRGVDFTDAQRADLKKRGAIVDDDEK